MARLEDYFRTDQRQGVRITSAQEVTILPENLKIPVNMYQDFGAGSVYFAFLLPLVPDPVQKCAGLVADSNLLQGLLAATPKLHIHQAGSPGETAVDSKSLPFTGRVYIYSENDLSDEEIITLTEFAAERGVHLQYFGPQWAEHRSELEKPLAFVSHDSRDKELFAKVVAEKLVIRGVPVWFSEFSLTVGDSLRESIEKGLRECEKCILILTPNFLSNPGWTKTEFNAIFTRELVERSRRILPVWAGVTAREVYKYSPTLADRVGAQWDEGVDNVVAKLIGAIRTDV
ncbi:MAG: hypothetical protein CVU68_07775 [Deltaproteobacteria bacterium HGW-Deltaproteobacteria-3]|nr:MAG: hypothetical protein CVU68_07775 [Deltaproteobacteria bacterium HGW-Deltaproteobacteria-3]